MYQAAALMEANSAAVTPVALALDFITASCKVIS